jgi:hypothetical protein
MVSKQQSKSVRGGIFNPFTLTTKFLILPDFAQSNSGVVHRLVSTLQTSCHTPHMYVACNMSTKNTLDEHIYLYYPLNLFFKISILLLLF